MHERERVHCVPFQGASLFCDDLVVVVGIGVCNAAAAGRYTLEATFVERLERHEKGSQPRRLLRVNQLLAAPELACSNLVLHFGDHHRDDGPGLRCARGLWSHRAVTSSMSWATPRSSRPSLLGGSELSTSTIELKSRFGIDPKFAPHIDAFYSARNALTHGLGTVRPEDARQDNTLLLRWIAFEVKAHGEETGSVIPIRNLFGEVTTEPMSVMLQGVERRRAFKIGEKVSLSAQDLYEICLFMSVYCIPQTIAAFVDYLKEQQVDGAAAP